MSSRARQRTGYAQVSHLETFSAKKDKQNTGCLGKPLGCRIFRTDTGLQYGLSGNPAIHFMNGCL